MTQKRETCDGDDSDDDDDDDVDDDGVDNGGNGDRNVNDNEEGASNGDNE